MPDIAVIYHWVFVAMLILAPVVCILLFTITAPYGRHERSGWGPSLPGKLGWFLMEAPASLLMLVPLLFVSDNTVVLLFLLLWQCHYLHRAFVYPFTLRSKRRMAVLVVLMAVVFNTANAFLNGFFLVEHAERYDITWLIQPNSLVGLLLFITGFVMTKRSDQMLARLRDESETGYQVPQGFLYRWVSCPNYLGESVQWLGWALLTLSPAGWLFLFWTLANLVPRAISHHRWYRQTFPDYPRNRKAFLPFLI